jgi:threonine dehydrogenase-like Zn-dependent dehydrogenase
MKAVTYHGTNDFRVDNVDDPKIENPTDAIIKVTATGICGSDLHLLSGNMAGMEKGDIIGHEPMGEVVEIGTQVSKLKVGDRVVVPFTIACGSCWFCNHDLYSLCDESNPNSEMASKVMGQAPAGLFGYSHLTGGFAGGQAEYLRVPYADVGPIRIDDTNLTDEQVLFLSDIFPTGYMAAENCDLQGGETVAVWGAGPVAQFTVQSLYMLGAGRVIVIDNVPERLAMISKHSKAETINFDEKDPYETLMAATDGRGPDVCVDAVGAEAHGSGLMNAALDKAKSALRLGENGPFVLQEVIKCCRKGGRISMPGVYTSTVDNIPMNAFMNKGLSLKTGQTHVQKYLRPLLAKIESGEIDPSFVITHTLPLDQAIEGYDLFREKKDNCIKVVLKPN